MLVLAIAWAASRLESQYGAFCQVQNGGLGNESQDGGFIGNHLGLSPHLLWAGFALVRGVGDGVSFSNKHIPISVRNNIRTLMQIEFKLDNHMHALGPAWLLCGY